MLTDGDIVRLRADPLYKEVIQSRLKGFATDLVRAGKGDLKPDLSLAVRLASALVKARIIRQELASSSQRLLERMLDSELAWPRIPASVRDICRAEPNYLWMRYDPTRVQALFDRSLDLISDAQYRDLVKFYSSFEGDKNIPLAQIREALSQLRDDTLFSIATRDVFDKITDLRKEEFYRLNETEIRRQLIEAGSGGALGRLPLPEPPEAP